MTEKRGVTLKINALAIERGYNLVVIIIVRNITIGTIDLVRRPRNAKSIDGPDALSAFQSSISPVMT